MESVLNVEVSCFANYSSPTAPKPVNLLTWLTSDKHREKVETIRAVNNKQERDKIKSTLPAITPSGLFTRRVNTALIKHSGLICLDIDPKGNEGIANYFDLKREICNIKNVAYCGLSVSGTGFFVLIPISQPDHHAGHFNALRELFQTKYKIRVDNTPDVSRLRGYSYDPDAYFNHTGRPFKEVAHPPELIPDRSDTGNRFNGLVRDAILNRIVNLAQSAGKGTRHNTLLKAARLAGGFVAAGRLDEQTAVYALETVASELDNFRDSMRVIKDGIRYGLVAPLQEEAQYKLPRQNAPAPRPVVTTIAGQLARPGSILRPDESQIERWASIETPDHYPALWDEPNPPGAVPTIKVLSLNQYLNKTASSYTTDDFANPHPGG